MRFLLFQIRSAQTQHISFSALESWINESASLFVRSDVEVVVVDLHKRDSGQPKGVSTSFTAAKGAKFAPRAKVNAITTGEGITECMRVQREDEYLKACIKLMLRFLI